MYIPTSTSCKHIEQRTTKPITPQPQHGGGAETAFCVAPVSRMPGRRAAQVAGSVLSVQQSLKRACQRLPRKAGPNRTDGLSRHSQVWSTLESASSASRVRAAQAPLPWSICRRPHGPRVIASGDDALDFRVVGQVAHVFFNVCADVLALDIEARSQEDFFLT